MKWIQMQSMKHMDKIIASTRKMHSGVGGDGLSALIHCITQAESAYQAGMGFWGSHPIRNHLLRVPSYGAHRMLPHTQPWGIHGLVTTHWLSDLIFQPSEWKMQMKYLRLWAAVVLGGRIPYRVPPAGPLAPQPYLSLFLQSSSEEGECETKAASKVL